MESEGMHRWALDRAAAAGACVLVLAFCVDLGSKFFAIAHGGLGLVVYNDVHAGDFNRRVLMSLVALAVTYAFADIARRRGYGRLWGAWIGVGLLVGGVLANGVSQFIWAQGVPDFIHLYSLSPDVWNIADFEIAWGLTGGIVSIAATVLIVYVREHRGPRGPLSDPAANVDG
jgi:hypothetical protein